MTDAQITAIASLIIAFLPVIITLGLALYRYFGHRSPQAKAQLMSDLADTVVPAIEQACSDMSGEHKKATAYENLDAILKSLHVSVPPELVNLSIEAAVHALNQQQQTSLPAVTAPTALVAPDSVAKVG